MKNDATDKQANLLEFWGVKVPKTKSIASRLIHYIINGNGTTGAKNSASRAAIVQEIQGKFLGQQVGFDGRRGTVIHISAKSVAEVSDQIGNHREVGQEVNPHPLLAYIKYNGGGAAWISVGRLQIVPAEQQTR